MRGCDRDTLGTGHDSMIEISTLQKRFEESNLGEIVISGFVILFILTGIVSNMPYSSIGRGLWPIIEPLALSTGLSQTWTMYAPEPPTQIDTLEVRAYMADGSERVWVSEPPGFGMNFLFAYPRWRNLSFAVIRSADLHPGYVHWAVGKLINSSERVVRAELIEKDEYMLPPGVQGQGDVTYTTLYAEDIQ